MRHSSVLGIGLWHGAVALALGGAVSTVSGYLFSLSGIDLPLQESVLLLLDGKSTPWQILAVSFICVALSPAIEELVFRKWIQRFLSSSLAPYSKRHAGIAAVLTATLFASAHLNAASFPALFALSFVFSRAYAKSGSIYSPIIAHAVFNGISVLCLLLSRNPA